MLILKVGISIKKQYDWESVQVESTKSYILPIGQINVREVSWLKFWLWFASDSL